MSDTPKTNHEDSEGSGQDFTPEDLRRLRAWTPPAAPDGFSGSVMALARSRRAPAAAPSSSVSVATPLSRADRERRQRRRSGMAATLGLVALSAAGGFVAWRAASGLTAAEAAGGVMSIYLGALAFGGVLLLASLLGAHGHADADAHIDVGHADAGPGADAEHGGPDQHAQPYDRREPDAGHADHSSLVLPFLSLRFWIFGLAFFGLTGAVLQWLALAGPVATAVSATVLGLAMGYGAARVFQSLARQTLGQLPADGGHIGREGKVLLPVSQGQRGKIRVVAQGLTTDLVAESDEAAVLPAGTTVLIVGMRGTVALVERSPTPNE